MCKVTDIASIISSLSYNKSFIVIYNGTGDNTKQINTPFRVRMMIATGVWTRNITSQWSDIYREYNNILTPSMSSYCDIVQSVSDSSLILQSVANRSINETDYYYFYYMFA